MSSLYDQLRAGIRTLMVSRGLTLTEVHERMAALRRSAPAVEGGHLALVAADLERLAAVLGCKIRIELIDLSTPAPGPVSPAAPSVYAPDSREEDRRRREQVRLERERGRLLHPEPVRDSAPERMRNNPALDDVFGPGVTPDPLSEVATALRSLGFRQAEIKPVLADLRAEPAERSVPDLVVEAIGRIHRPHPARNP